MVKYIIELADEQTTDKDKHYLNKLKYFGLINAAASLYFLSKHQWLCISKFSCGHLHVQDVSPFSSSCSNSYLGNTLDQ